MNKSVKNGLVQCKGRFLDKLECNYSAALQILIYRRGGAGMRASGGELFRQKARQKPSIRIVGKIAILQ